MSPERIQRVEDAIARCEAVGLVWTNQMIYQLVQGNYGELAQYLKERRARDAAPVAVMDEETPYPEETPCPDDSTAAAVIETEGVLEDELPTAPEPEKDELATAAPAALAPLTPMEVLQETLRTATMAELDAHETWARAMTEYKAYVAQLQRTPPQGHTAVAAAKDHLLTLQERLQEHVREREVKAQAAREASWAFYNAKKTARYVLKRLHQAQLCAATAPAYLLAAEQRKAEQFYTELVAVVGEAKAERLVNDRSYQPAWLREG